MELEYCVECDGPTGNAGRYEDSIYIYYPKEDIEIGPLCDDCSDKHRREEMRGI